MIIVISFSLRIWTFDFFKDSIISFVFMLSKFCITWDNSPWIGMVHEVSCYQSDIGTSWSPSSFIGWLVSEEIMDFNLSTTWYIDGQFSSSPSQQSKEIYFHKKKKNNKKKILLEIKKIALKKKRLYKIKLLSLNPFTNIKFNIIFRCIRNGFFSITLWNFHSQTNIILFTFKRGITTWYLP